MPGERLELIGAFRLLRAGRTVAVPPSGQRVLALLAVHGPMPRERVAALLRPDAAPAVAQAWLRSVLTRGLGGAWAAGALRTDADGLALPAEVEVDLRGVLDALPALAAGDLAGLHALPDQVELLPGWYTDDWVLQERDRVRDRVLAALLRGAARCASPASALELAQRAVRIDGLHEDAVRQVITAHLALGDVAPALTAYHDLVLRLRRELDVAPEPATTALVRRWLPPAGRRPAGALAGVVRRGA